MDKLETGDILLFHGVGSYFNPLSYISPLIEYFTHSNWSHVAIVLRNPYLDGKMYSGLYVLESSLEDIKDVTDDQTKFGVTVIPLEECIKKYQGNIYYRKLNTPIKKITSKINKIYSDIKNKPYDLNVVDWVKAYYKIYEGKLSWIYFTSFCFYYWIKNL